MKTTSVTDLKAHLSARLKEVAAGEPLLVTDRKKPVAILQPLPSGGDDTRLAGLIAAGIVSPPKGRLDVEAFLAMPKGHCDPPLSVAIIEDRDSR